MKSGGRDRHWHIVDELVDERCIRLKQWPRLWNALQTMLFPYLKINDTKDVVDIIGAAPCDRIMAYLEQELQLKLQLNNLHHMPATGPCILVANHPTGMIDALAIYFAVRGVRRDVAIFSNRDAIRAAPALADVLIPVEWMEANRTRQRMRETLSATRHAFDNGKAIVIFPAGGIARITARGVRDPSWLDTTVKLARKHQVPIVPLHLHSRNSAIYYLLELFHSELRDLTRFREMFLKRNTVFDFTFGPPIELGQIASLSTEAATARLHRYVEFELPRGKPWSI